MSSSGNQARAEVSFPFSDWMCASSSQPDNFFYFLFFISDIGSYQVPNSSGMRALEQIDRVLVRGIRQIDNSS